LPIDIDASIERAGDPDFWQVLLDAYFDETAERIASLCQSYAAGDLTTFIREAHTIKGSSAEILAEPMRQVALELESMGKGGDLTRAAESIARLEQEFDRLRRYVESTAVAG
jgi:HPt (histidine-containing phosphotransfer) domain-containing protein